MMLSHTEHQQKHQLRPSHRDQQHRSVRSLRLLGKREALKGSGIKPRHYALVIREACGRIIIISADQKITNNNGHQRGGARGHVSLQANSSSLKAGEQKKHNLLITLTVFTPYF